MLSLYGPLEVIRVALGDSTGVALPVAHALAPALVLLTVALLLWQRRTRVTDPA